MKNIENYIKQIPLYSSLYGMKLNDFTFDHGLNEYPILERNHIIDGFPNNWMTPILEKSFKNQELEFTTTSGSSGQRIQIFRKQGWWKEEYVRTYQHSKYLKQFQVGIDRKAILTTAICSNAACYLDFPEYQERIISNTLYLNLSKDPNDWNKRDVERIIWELNEYKPKYLDADPVYLAILFKKITEMEISIPLYTPEIVTLSYEMITVPIRRFIESRWDIPIINLYGTTELGYLYVEEDGKLKRCQDLSTVEFIPFSEKRGIYYLIPTSLKNEYMPFVRFKIGDLVKFNPEIKPSDLNNDSEIEFFCGREKDVFINNCGEAITPGEIDYSLSDLENEIFQYQLQIMNANLIVFRYTTIGNKMLSKKHQIDITSKISDIFGSNISLQFKLERSISPELSGKFATVKYT